MTDSEETFICHQTNCISVQAHGLSAQIASKWPKCDIYAKRKPIGNRNLTKDPDTPGTIKVYKRSPNKFVVCMLGQYGMGKPFSYNNIGGKLYEKDSSRDRLYYFKLCIRHLEHLATIDPIATFALPFKIGCGLAGGNWTKYKKVLEDSSISDKLTVYQFE